MFKSGYKLDARTYNVQREDITSILKHGRSIHGEWFCNGVRLPGGKFRGDLPEAEPGLEGGVGGVLGAPRVGLAK